MANLHSGSGGSTSDRLTRRPGPEPEVLPFNDPTPITLSVHNKYSIRRHITPRQFRVDRRGLLRRRAIGAVGLWSCLAVISNDASRQLAKVAGARRRLH